MTPLYGSGCGIYYDTVCYTQGATTRCSCVAKEMNPDIAFALMCFVGAVVVIAFGVIACTICRQYIARRRAKKHMGG